MLRMTGMLSDACVVPQGHCPSMRGLETGDKDIWALPGRIQLEHCDTGAQHPQSTKTATGWLSGMGEYSRPLHFYPNNTCNHQPPPILQQHTVPPSPLHTTCCTTPKTPQFLPQRAG